MSNTLVQHDTILHADGRRLAGRWIRPNGTPAGPANLVFLHEGLGCIAMWEDFPEAVVAATGLPALVYDRYGYGGSDPLDGPLPVDWMEHEALVALPQVLAETGIENPLLIGHSDGGTIALVYGAHHPCAGIVTEAAHIYQDDLTHKGQAFVREQFDKGAIQEVLEPHHGDRTGALVCAWLAHWGSPEKRDWDISEMLPRIDCPLLAIQGERDRFGEPAQLDNIVGGVGAGAQKLFVTDCGHVPHHQARETVLAAVTEFIATLG